MGNVPLIKSLQSKDDCISLRFNRDADHDSAVIETSKAFLIKISPVFEAAFTQGFKETHASEMFIDNFKKDDVLLFLHFAAVLCFPYHSVEDLNCKTDESIVRLLPIAEFYQSSIVHDELISYINANPALKTCAAAEQANGGHSIKWKPHVYTNLAKEVWKMPFVRCTKCKFEYQRGTDKMCSGEQCAEAISDKKLFHPRIDEAQEQILAKLSTETLIIVMKRLQNFVWF